jgi:ABC-2 type transport system ATP-binding protein
VLRDSADVDAAAGVVAGIAGAEPEIDRDARRVNAPVRDRIGALTATMRALEQAGVTVEDLALRRPTLDEVFLRLTGRPEVAA